MRADEFATQAAVLLLELGEGGRIGRGWHQGQLLLPQFKSLGADAQFGGHGRGGLAARQPPLDGLALEVLVVPFATNLGCCFGVVHGVCF
jgi:hypothetical protein